MEEIYFGRGTAEQFDDYVDFINYVFGFNGNQKDFKKLLPKLYKPESNPAYHSFNAVENGKFRAAIGVYEIPVQVCGEKLMSVGVGNVAVHPYFRSRGYMKKLLNMALEDMIASGADFSFLGGQRQRYNYFSYEKCGTQLNYTVSQNNLRHYFKEETPMTMEKVLPEDRATLDAVYEMGMHRNFFADRERGALYAILSSWEAEAYIFRLEGKITGYCVLLNGHVIKEIHAENPALFPDMVRAIVSRVDQAEFHIPEFQMEYCRVLEGVCEEAGVSCGEMFSVFCYRRVIRAFMQLKQTYEDLPDGTLCLKIHGRAGDEQLCICVSDGKISVEETEALPQLELSHLEAMRLLFQPLYVGRNNLPAFARLWFPLPIWMFCADGV